MKWRPSPPELIQTFQEVVPDPPALQKKMFGYPAAFVNGNMVMGLFPDQMIVRLPEGDRETLNRAGGTAFEPMQGRPMREYAVLPRAILENRKALSSWVSKALAYGRSLPPKASKGAEKRGAAAGKPRATIAKRS